MMFGAGSWFWLWLADQPAFVEVGIGMCFVLLIAPAALTAVPITLARVEAVVGVSSQAGLPSGHSPRPSSCSRWFRFGVGTSRPE